MITNGLNGANTLQEMSSVTENNRFIPAIHKVATIQFLSLTTFSYSLFEQNGSTLLKIVQRHALHELITSAIIINCKGGSTISIIFCYHFLSPNSSKLKTRQKNFTSYYWHLSAAIMLNSFVIDSFLTELYS